MTAATPTAAGRAPLSRRASTVLHVARATSARRAARGAGDALTLAFVYLARPIRGLTLSWVGKTVDNPGAEGGAA